MNGFEIEHLLFLLIHAFIAFLFFGTRTHANLPGETVNTDSYSPPSNRLP
jgi:hypothetical protein